MDIKISIILKDKDWGFSDLLDGRELNNQTKKEIIELINEDIGYAFEQQIEVEQLTLTNVVSSFNLEIKDRDIATIEALHDTLLDKKVLGLNARSMKESRALTQRMYKALSKD